MLFDDLSTITLSANWLVASIVPGLVSVVVPVWNRAGLICSTLDTLRRQTYRPIEILVIDDGSKDGTGRVVKNWAEEHADNQLSCRYCYQNNRGQNIARNVGVQLASGEFIQFMDSDDLVHPKKIEYSVSALLTNPEAEFVISRVERFHDANTVIQKMGKEPFGIAFKADPKRRPWYTSIRFECWQGVYRRSLLARVGPMDDIRAGGTYPYMMRIKLHSQGSVFLPYILDFYREDTENAMSRCNLPLRVLSNLTSLKYMKRDLKNFGIIDRKEWLEVVRFAFRNYRKAVASGDRELRRSAYTELKGVAFHWSIAARIVLVLPENTFYVLTAKTAAIKGNIARLRERLNGRDAESAGEIV